MKLPPRRRAPYGPAVFARFRYPAQIIVWAFATAIAAGTALLVELEIGDIWAKAISRQHGRILERIGAAHAVLPEHDMGERVAHLVSGRMLDYIAVDEHFALAKTRPPKELVGIPLGDTGLRRKHGVTVVSVKSEGEEFTYATPDTVLQYGDLIIIAGATDKVERFTELL